MRARMIRKGFTEEAVLELVRGCDGRICRGGEKGAIVGCWESSKMSIQREEQALSEI